MITYSEEIKSMNLWEKIAQISSEIEYLQKDDTVGFGKNAYKAISVEKVVTAVSEKMGKYGVVIYPIEQKYSRTDEQIVKADGSPGVNRISDVDVKYEVVNIHNLAEKIVTVSSGTGVDTQDKGIGKAMTYAYKNMIIKVFQIATGDDTDKVHSDDYSNNLYGTDNKQKEQTNKKLDDARANNQAGKLSNAQFSRLYAIAKKAGYDYKHVARHVTKKYNKQVEELNKTEYDEMCEGYEKLSNKEVS